MSLKYLIAIKIETQNGDSALINGCDSCVDSVSLNSLNTLEIFFCNVNKSHWKLPTFYIMFPWGIKIYLGEFMDDYTN